MPNQIKQSVTQTLHECLRESIAAKEAFLLSDTSGVCTLVERMLQSFRAGGKVVLFGNGGSAADAQHVAGELVGRFKKDRAALAAIALTTDSSVITCIANDMSYDDVFARQVEALAGKDDVIVGISTSGNSANVLKAIAAAKARGAFTVAFTGRTGGKLKAAADLCLCVPCDNTARVQEVQITVWHAICQIIEQEMFG